MSTNFSHRYGKIPPAKAETVRAASIASMRRVRRSYPCFHKRKKFFAGKVAGKSLYVRGCK